MTAVGMIASSTEGTPDMTRHFSMIRDFHLADLFTLLNGACGTAAIFFAMSHIAERSDGKIYAAGAFVVLAREEGPIRE
jgi:CDP-diacylglycerol--serine O-phosphatidyltransferase